MFLALTVMSLWTSAAAAAEAGRPMSRAEAIDRALAHALDIESRRAIERGVERLRRPVPPPNPEVTLEWEGDSHPFSTREYTHRVRFQQELGVRGGRSARQRVGTAAAGVLEEEVRVQEQAVVAVMDDAITRWLIARRRAALLAPIQERAVAIRAKAESARGLETITGFDARLLRSEALEREEDGLEAQRDLKEAEAELRVRLVLSPEAIVNVEDDLDTLSWRCQPDSLTQVALRTRSDLARARASEALADARVRLESRLGGLSPRIGISVARERTRVEDRAGDLLESADTFVGLEVAVPLPLFPRNSVGIAEAAGELARAQAEREVLEAQARQDVAAACAALEQVEERRVVASDAAANAAQDLGLIEDAYVGGRITIAEYLALRDRLLRLQLGAIDAQGVVEAQRSRLVRVTGARRSDLARMSGAER